MKNGIVIPCYNEEKRLDLSRFNAFLQDSTNTILCFVNDGSRDQTLRVLHSIQSEHPNKVMVYDMPQNGGKAEAVRAGVLHLLRESNVQTVGYLDADLATDFEDYGHLVDRAESNSEVQCIVGSRKCGDQGTIERSLFRDVASRLVAILIHLIIGMPIKDTQCGAKVFKRALAQHLFQNPFQSRWLFDVELFIRMKNYYGREVVERFREVALQRWVEVEGSKITLKDTLKMPVQLMNIAFAYHVEPHMVSAKEVILLPFGSLRRAA